LTCDAVYKTYIKSPNNTTPVPNEIQDSKKLHPFFKDALGAIDDSHLLVCSPAAQCTPFCDRKGQTTQNLLAYCTFDLQLCHLLTGWEGSASDSAILHIHTGMTSRCQPTNIFSVMQVSLHAGSSLYPIAVSITIYKSGKKVLKVGIIILFWMAYFNGNSI